MKFDESLLYNIKSDYHGIRYSLFDLAIWKNGLAFKKIDFSDKGLPVIKIAELNNGISSNTSFTQGDYGEEVFIHWDDLLFSWSGNPQTSIDVFRYRLPDGWLNQHIFKVTAKSDLVTKDFLYYTLKYLKPYFTQIATNKQTTGLGHVTIADLKRMSVVIPQKEIQQQITSILKAIDDKIEVNSNINENLYDQMLAIFNKAKDTASWNRRKLSDVLTFFDNLRKPLSSMQREKMEHIYPYYGATSIVDYVEDYLFEGTYILVSEDGANVVDLAGHPLTQYTHGKFWVNNHAHIVKGTNGYSEALVYALLGTLNMQSIVTGAAQPKINQANLRNFEAVLPESNEAQELSNILNPMLQQMILNDQENERLSALRDTLLPQLMSGLLDISSIEL